ncbi:ubiquitin-like domain-containing protein [Streptomyces sp. wa22]|uniref:ubiquitin-like domain-containing protein n=1 Tax=Streptomyces sp. wa22 TaxID=1828244 RepID=UPI0039673720
MAESRLSCPRNGVGRPERLERRGPFAGQSPRAARQSAHGAGRAAPESLRRIVPRALVVAVLAGGTVVFLAQDKAVHVSVDGTSRTLHTFADDVGELLDAEGVTVGARDTVAPAPATGLDDGDEIVVRRGTRGSGPVPGRGPRAPRRP